MTSHGRGQVWVDGKALSATAVRFEAAVDEPNTVDIALVAERVTISGPADVTMRARTKWAPSYFEFNERRGVPK